MRSPTFVHFCGSSAIVERTRALKTLNSSESASVVGGTWPAFSHSVPLCTSIVASPPSSRIMLGASSPDQVRISFVQAQYSSRLSPFQANTGTPFGSSGVPSGPTTTAAAAASSVE